MFPLPDTIAEYSRTLGIHASYLITAPCLSNSQNATCFRVVRYCPLFVALGLKTVVLKYTTEEATDGQPEVNSTTRTSEKTPYSGGEGMGAKAKKYSVESSNPAIACQYELRLQRAWALTEISHRRDSPLSLLIEQAGGN